MDLDKLAAQYGGQVAPKDSDVDFDKLASQLGGQVVKEEHKEEPKKITSIKQDQGNSFLTDALDFVKQIAAPAIGALPTVPRGIEQGARGAMRASAEGEPSSIMPSSVYNPALDTEETLFGPETQRETAARKLNAQRAIAQIPEIPGLKTIADIGHRATENIQKSISPEAKKAIKESTPTGNLFKGELSFGNNPTLYGYALQGANVFGSLLPVLVGTMITKDPNTGAVIGAGMAADEASTTAAQTINKLSDEQLAQQSPFYAQMIHGGASPKEARDLTIRKAAETGAKLQGIVAGFGDKVTGHLISGSFDNMIEKLTGKSILAKAAGTGAVSSLEEGTQETSEGVASNVGLQSVLPDTELGEGSAANFALGALGGAGPGAVRGAVSGIQGKLAGQEETPTEPYTPAQPQTPTASAYQMPSGQQAAPNPLQREQQVKQEVNNPIPPVPSFTSAPGAYSATPNAAPINVEPGQIVDANGEIIKGAPPVIQKEIALKQEIEHPELSATSAAATPEPTHAQFGAQIDPETGEILNVPTATPTPAPAVNEQEHQEKIQTETARLVSKGFPLDDAKAMAEKKVNKQEQPQASTPAPTQVADEILNAKIEERATEIATLSNVPYKEAIKMATKELKGEPNAAGPNAPTTGAGVQTSGQPAQTPGVTAGAQGVEPNGVVPSEQNAPSNNVGEGTQPTPIVFKEDLELKKLEARIKEEDERDAAYEKQKAEARIIGIANAQTLFDQTDSGDYESLQRAIDGYEENVGLTLTEQGLRKDPNFDYILKAALDAFKEEVERLKAEQTTTEPTPTSANVDVEAPSKERQAEIDAGWDPALPFRPLDLASKEMQRRVGQDPFLTKEQKKQIFSFLPGGEGYKRLVAALGVAPKEEKTETQKPVKRQTFDEFRKAEFEAAKQHVPEEERAGIKNFSDLAKYNKENGIEDEYQGQHTTAGEYTKAIKEKWDEQNKTNIKSANTIPAVNSKVNNDFKKATTAKEALKIVIATGTEFQKLIARRLQKSIGNFKFGVIEQGQLLPEELKSNRAKSAWSKSIGLFVENPVTRMKAVFVRGSSFAVPGANNVTVLHEIWHGATSLKLIAARDALANGYSENTNLVRAYKELLKIMANAKVRAAEMEADGTLTPRLKEIIDRNDIFNDDQEFLAYGMSDQEFQNFLHSARGFNEGRSFFSGFLDSMRRMLGIPDGHYTALTNLIAVSDRVVNSKMSSSMSLAQRGMPAETTKSATTPPQPRAPPTTKLNAVVSKGEKAVAASEAGRELSANLSALQMLRNPTYIWDSVRANWSGLSDSARKFISHAYDSEALAYGGPGSVITELPNTHKLLQRMSGMTQNILKGAADEANAIVDFFRENPKLRTTFENLVNGTTIDQYDPSKPQAKKNATYDKWYASLGQKGQDLYNRLKDYYVDMRDYQQHLLEDQIKALNLPKQEEAKLLKALQDKFADDKLKDPYFPLMRYGDYVLEFGKGAKRVVIRYETVSERNLAAIRQARKFGKSLSQARTNGDIKITNDIGSTNLRSTIEGTSELLKSVYEAIDTANLQNPGAAAALKDNVYQAYLAAMPEQSVRKLFMHRTGVAGFSPDVLKNVNNMGIKMPKQFAKLKYAPQLRNSLDTARAQLEGKEEYTPFVARMAEFVGEEISPTPKSELASYGDIIAGGLTKLSFLHYMTSWSSAMLQPLDIFMKGVPVLTGSHGPKAVAEISKVLAFWNTFGITEKQPDGTIRFNAPSIQFAKGLTADQQRAIADLHTFDVTRSTLTNEVFNQAKTPVTKVDSKGVAAAKLAGRTLILGGLMHHGERLSREVIYLASYNLTRAEGIKEGLQPGENHKDMLERVHNEAVDKAVQETNETFGNYSPYNRPMVMRGALGKIATQYKFFPLVTSKLLVGNFFKMLPMMNKEGKVEAATKFFGIMGTHLLFGGLVALPLFSTVMGMLGAAWRHWGKDDDAPDDMKSLDYETWFRTVHLKELLGDTGIGDLSELAERGLLNKLTGLDISSRISLNDLWFRDPAPGKDLKASVQNWGMTLGGAGINYALSFAKGLQSIGNGDYEQGMEAIAPGAISGLMAAHRESNEGIKNSQGHTLVEKGKVGPGVLAGQAVGFKSDIAQSRQNAIFKTDAVDRQIYLERQNILDKIKEYKLKSMDEDKGKAYQDRFESKYEDALDRVTDFNERNPEKKVTGKEIKEALLGHLKKFGAAEGNEGMTINKKNARLAEPIRETLESREPK